MPLALWWPFISPAPAGVDMAVLRRSHAAQCNDRLLLQAHRCRMLPPGHHTKGGRAVGHEV